MATGRIKWWDNKKGFGFILQDSGRDIFVHYSNVTGKGFKTLSPGDEVTFELIDSEKGPKAQNVQRAETPSEPAA
jgi:cold shock protein